MTGPRAVRITPKAKNTGKADEAKRDRLELQFTDLLQAEEAGFIEVNGRRFTVSEDMAVQMRTVYDEMLARNEKYMEYQAAADTAKAAELSSDKSAETAEVLTNGEKKLSDTAKDYLSGLRKQHEDTDFIVTGEGDDEAKLAKASKKEFTVILSGEEVERMATDEDYAKQQLRSMETTWKMNERIAEQYGGGQASGSR